MLDYNPGMSRRPAAEEHAPYYGRYIDLVPEEDICAALAAQAEETQRMLSSIGAERAGFRYAPGKWSIKEVIGHVTDSERVFGFRALAIARGETTPLPGFDENEYVRNAGFDRCSLDELADALALVRRANVLFFRSLPPIAWERRGVANDNPVSVRALAYIILGHERHHLNVLRERYLSAS